MKSNKLTKNVLKEIVKECLVEILAEGLVTDSTERSRHPAVEKTRTLKESILRAKETTVKSKESGRKPSYLDSIDFNKGNLRKNNKLDEIAASVTSDPILSEMLADTAHTTLQQQIAAENNPGHAPVGKGDKAARLVETSTPESLFGEEASSKWASLAFGN